MGAQAKQTLCATPETAEALAGADALSLLVGSYDGSGNYGDIAQLDATLGLLDRLSPSLPAVPVLERQYAQTHQRLAGELLHRPPHVLYFDDGTGSFEDGLVPLPPTNFAFALSYLYGGGFLNPSWGERKLAMLRAVERVLQGAGTVTRVATGQQVEAGWIAGLRGDDARLLASFELLGARDDASTRALGRLRTAGVAANTGDDAVGLLADVEAGPTGGSPEDAVNVHVAEHQWVTGDPAAVRGFAVGLLAELARILGRPLRVRPLLAYLDPRVDERPGLERFADACSERGIEVEEARVLRPASLAEDARALSRALLTVSCSYHVALTSLLLGVPTLILRDNPYYDQKARGLLDDFGLPDGFSPASEEDPARAAREIAPTLLEGGEETRARLREAGARVRRRRVEVETDLLAKLEEAVGGHHEISDLQTGPGELSFDARIAGQTRSIWFRSETEVEPYPEAALAAVLMPAMRSGGRLTMTAPISPRVLRMQREFQGIQQAWSREWAYGDPPLREVEVKAPVRPVERRRPTGRVALFFSGGVDSWSTLLGEDEVTDLIFVRGLDILARAPHQEGLADRVEARLREAASELGLPLHGVETNARDLSELNGPAEPVVRWESYYNSALSAVALFLGPLFDRVLISTGLAYRNQSRIGGSWMVDLLWSNEDLEIVDVGGNLGRVERTRRIAAHPLVQKSLRVCWHNPDGAYNCGRCRKCLVTMATLEGFGQLQNFQTFPRKLEREHLELLAAQKVQEPLHLDLCEEALEAIRLSGKPELEQALEELVARGRQTLGRAPEDPEATATARLEEVLSSRSWRLTAPLRRLAAHRRSR